MQECALAWPGLAPGWGFLASLWVSVELNSGQLPAPREKSKTPNISPSGCSGCPAKLSFGGKRGPGVFLRLTICKSCGPRTSRSPAGTSQERRAALERARHPPPPWAAARPRPGSQGCSPLRGGWAGGGTRSTRRAGRGASHVQPREFPRVQGVLGLTTCSGQCLCCPGAGCVSTGGGKKRITLIFVSKSRAWKPKADFSGDSKDTLSLWALPWRKSLIARERVGGERGIECLKQPKRGSPGGKAPFDQENPIICVYTFPT